MKDNRVIYLDFFGPEYPMCLTVLGNQRVDETWGGLDALSALLKQGNTDALLGWCELILILMEGGAARVKTLAWMADEDAPPLPQIPTLETLSQIISWADISSFGDTIMAAVAGSTQQTVEVEEGKNVETTQG